MARPSYLKYPDDWYRKVYPGMADSEWKELVKETEYGRSVFRRM